MPERGFFVGICHERKQAAPRIRGLVTVKRGRGLDSTETEAFSVGEKISLLKGGAGKVNAATGKRFPAPESERRAQKERPATETLPAGKEKKARSRAQTISTRIVPTPFTPPSRRSPGRTAAAPEGVPVKIRSPGLSSQNFESSTIVSRGFTMRLAVEPA